MALVTVQVQGADGRTHEVVGDLIGGRFYPIYKGGFGVEGAFSLIAAGTPLPVAVRNVVVVDGSGVVQPISSAALPLPAGASTALLQQVADLDTGAEVDNRRATGILLAEDGGPLLMGSANPVPVYASGQSRDGLANALVGIDYAHHEVHDGNSYICEAVDEDMGNNDILILAFRTMAAAKRMHLIMSFASKAAAHVDLIEAPTWTNQTGALQPVHNRNRASANTTDVLEDQSSPAFLDTNNMILNPTGLAGGTVIHDLYTWSDKKMTTKDRDQDEFILAADTQYAVRLTADAATNAGQIILTWYEHVDV